MVCIDRTDRQADLTVTIALCILDMIHIVATFIWGVGGGGGGGEE